MSIKLDSKIASTNIHLTVLENGLLLDIWYIKHVLSALSLPTKGAFICTFTIPLSRAHPNTSMTRRPYTIVHPHVKNNKQEYYVLCATSP